MRTAAAAGLGLFFVMAGCDPCAGTPSCHTDPEISHSGQFIEFPSGRAVAGVHVAFARTQGPALIADTVSTTSDRGGFFALRVGALGDGVVEGDLIVTPPAPHKPYTVRGIRLETNTKRGDGGFLGRLMVNPYLQYIGELHDARTNAVVTGATITVRQLGPARVAPETTVLTSAENGRFMWEPEVIEFGTLDVEFEVTASGYPIPYRLRATIALQYLDEPPRLAALLVGGGLRYLVVVRRRGTKLTIPGVTVEFIRTGGIAVTPSQFTVTPDQDGAFSLPLETPEEGTVIGDLTIRPPAPLPPETYKDIELSTFDGGLEKLISLDYGPATILRPLIVYRATGLPIREGTHARFTHVGGLADVIPLPWGTSDDGVRIVDSTGVVGYDAATLDTGTVLYDIEVRLNEPHDWETFRAIPVPARRSDVPHQDTLRVGSWFPWVGEVRDDVTDAPIAGASVRFRRVGGASVRPSGFTVQSRADGTFPLQPEPLGRGPVDAMLSITTGGAYRDTIVRVRLQPAQDDSIRSVGTFRLSRIQP